MTPDFENEIKRGIARAFALAWIQHNREKLKPEEATLYFYSRDFGNIFEALSWKRDACIEINVKLAKSRLPRVFHEDEEVLGHTPGDGGK